MPNHCMNELTIRGPQADLDQLRRHLRGLWPWDSLVTHPDCHVMPLCVTNHPDLYPPQAARRDYNGAGHRWCVANLGTKWGAYDVEEQHCAGILLYHFNTAWCPFDTAVWKLWGQLYPQCSFDYLYDESGQQFEGSVRVSGGEVVEEWQSGQDDYTGQLTGPPEPSDEEEAQ